MTPQKYRSSSSETFIIDEKGYLIRDTSDFSVNSCEITSLPLQKIGHQSDSKVDCGSVELSEAEKKTSVLHLSDDENHYSSGTDFDEEDSLQNMTIDVALVKFVFFWNKQFSVPSPIFFRTTGGQVVYDENQRTFVTRFMDKT